MTVIPRGLGWAARRLRVTLRYSQFVTISNPGSVQCNRRLNPTYCYDVDPLLGSTSMPGFNEYANIYRFYRLRSSSLTCNFSNVETFPVMVYITPINYDPGANATPTEFLTGSMLCRKKVLGPLTGEGTGTVSSSISTNVLTGIKDVQVADSYTAPTSGASTPANSWYWAFGSIGTAVGVSGVAVNFNLECTIEFFELTNPAG